MGSISASVVFLLTFAANPAHAEKPVMTLAMVRYNQSPAQRFMSGPNVLTISIAQPAAVPSRNDGEQALQLETAKEATFLRGQYLERQTPYRHALFELVHTNLRNYDLPGVWMSVQAGFGQLWQGKSAINNERNGAGWQEPSCAYIKAVFNF